MNNNIKYLYFERYRITGYQQTEFEIRNCFILKNKPENTGSEGIDNCMNITERFGFPEKSYFVVDQYWVDLTKYKFEDKQLNENIEYVLNKLNNIEHDSINNILDDLINHCEILSNSNKQLHSFNEGVYAVLGKIKYHKTKLKNEQ